MAVKFAALVPTGVMVSVKVPLEVTVVPPGEDGVGGTENWLHADIQPNAITNSSTSAKACRVFGTDCPGRRNSASPISTTESRSPSVSHGRLGP
jgi:hypothetical protein